MVSVPINIDHLQLVPALLGVLNNLLSPPRPLGLLWKSINILPGFKENYILTTVRKTLWLIISPQSVKIGPRKWKGKKNFNYGTVLSCSFNKLTCCSGMLINNLILVELVRTQHLRAWHMERYMHSSSFH